jgi:NAD(P)-dependent dehydrogenase (short-subunit alcohol dehydrogenase family)
VTAAPMCRNRSSTRSSGHIADPDDMARAALFLLSGESRWTTGIVLPCEGGYSAGGG